MSPSVEPFNENKYKILMDGLECSEILKSDLEAGERIDAEYYQKKYLQYQKLIEKQSNNQLSQICDFMSGPFGSAYDTGTYVKTSDYRYVRGQDVKPFVLQDDSPRYMAKEDYIRLNKYYSAFIKSWIAFNSWYRSEYTERTDRGIIEKLKTENNRFKGYIETMLDENNNSDEAIIFKKNLKDLQAALVNAAIVTQERDGINQQISFSEIAINNPKRVAEGDYRVTHYKVQRTNEKISTLVHKKNDPTMIYFQFEQKKYDETELDVHADFLRLGIEQQGQCKAFYKEICPYVIESVLTRDKDNKVEFIAERSQVSRGIIEVLYLLRCSLMHGEVFPDNNAMEVYKYAYSILAAILKKMF